jgi:hypothetical protein
MTNTPSSRRSLSRNSHVVEINDGIQLSIEIVFAILQKLLFVILVLLLIVCIFAAINKI